MDTKLQSDNKYEEIISLQECGWLASERIAKAFVWLAFVWLCRLQVQTSFYSCAVLGAVHLLMCCAWGSAVVAGGYSGSHRGRKS